MECVHQDLFDSVWDYLSNVRREQPSWSKDKSRAHWLDEVVIGHIDAITCLQESEPFYRGQQCRKPQELLSWYLENDWGFLTTLWSLFEKGLAGKGRLPNEDQLEVLQMAVVFFHACVKEVTGVDADRLLSMAEANLLTGLETCCQHDTPENRELLLVAAHAYAWRLHETAYRLTVLEYRIWYEHQEWELLDFESSSGNRRDCRELVNSRGMALKKFDEDHPGIFDAVADVWGNLNDQVETRPVAFIGHDERTGALRSFAASVRDVLLLVPYVWPLDPERTQEEGEERWCLMVPNAGLRDAHAELVAGLRNYFNRRALAERPQSPARRLWFEAEAELLAKLNRRYDAATVERVLRLADEAQRESWLQAKLNGERPDGDEDADPSPAQDAPKAGEAISEDAVVRLSELLARRLSAPPAPEKPKPRKRNRPGTGRKNPLMGRSTMAMKRQLKDFGEWIGDGHPANDGQRAHTVGARAVQYWKKNIGRFEREMKCGGQEKGYSCAKALADAYRNATACP